MSDSDRNLVSARTCSIFVGAEVDATARKAQVLGAKTVLPLTDIPNVGRF